ncbi:DNA polymerase I [Actinomycetaceae bacterium TAE3-ERU4]|nr:DNA polymerase I [Actinomycetaceae bacterium TAE3-ERU4]
MNKKLLVLDGHSIAFRAFFALREADFRAPNGQATGAVHGFLNMLLKMLDEEKPTHVAVAFDLGRKSFRTEEYAEYKGGREETPEDFIGQVPIIKEILAAMNIGVLTKVNYEADDILATLAKTGAQSGYEVLLASGDRDAFQLINDNVTVLWPGQSPTDVRHMDAAAVEAKYGVSPELYPHLAALVGESADNLPGVPGVGPKTAAQWINKYGNLTNLLEKADEIGGKRGQALRDHLEDVKRNRKLNRLVDNLELELGLDDLELVPFNREELESIFTELDFNRLAKRILSWDQKNLHGRASSRLDDSSETLKVSSAKSRQITSEEVLFDFETDKSVSYVPDSHPVLTPAHLEGGLKSWILKAVGEIAVYATGNSSFASCELDMLYLATESEIVEIDRVFLPSADEKALEELLTTSDSLVYLTWKESAHLIRSAGFPTPRFGYDVSLASYVCDPGRHKDDPVKLIAEILETEIGISPLPRKENERREAQIKIARRCAEAILPLKKALQQQLVSENLESLFQDLELPISKTLFDMEVAGIGVNRAELDCILEDLNHLVARAQENAYAAIGGQEVNLSSPRALQKVLFEDLNMPPTKKTKTGYTTNAAALVDLYERTEHPFLGALLEHRDKIKLSQTVQGLKREIASDGRIHTTFQQTVTATGRLSSTNPNLQNIPARTVEGQRLREIFVPGKGASNILTADYSQIEMRIMAHSSDDEQLITAFNSGEDVHSTMAAIVFGVSPTEVSPAQRSKIKAMSYGLVYGLSAFGLSKQLRISMGEASNLMEIYFSRFGGVKDYLDGIVRQARQDGYTKTILGRRRYLPDLASPNRQVRENAERAALNAPIQGSAADIIKLAMLTVARRIEEKNLRSRMLLQVHDELVFEVFSGEEEVLKSLVTDSMTRAMKLKVPLEVSVGFGNNWRAAAH